MKQFTSFMAVGVAVLAMTGCGGDKIRLEAEDGQILGDASINSEGYVENISSLNSGVRVLAPLNAQSLTMGYMAEQEGTLTVKVNGKIYSSFEFDKAQNNDPGIPEWRFVAINKAVKAGSVVDLVYQKGDQNVTIDYLEFSKSKIPSVSTIASVGQSVDGITMTPEGNLLLSGANPILHMSPTGEVSHLPVSVFESFHPLGLDYDSKGNLLAANLWHQGVEIYPSEGQNQVLVSGAEFGFNGPNDLVVLSNDQIVASNCGNGSAGTDIVRLGPDNYTNFENVVIEEDGWNCMAGITRDQDDNLYVSNWTNGRLFKVTPDNTVTIFGEVPGGNINHITFNNGYLYAPVANQAKIYRFNAEGDVEEWGTEIPRPIDGDIRTADFIGSANITTANDGETLYVVDGRNTLSLLRKIEYLEQVPQSPIVSDEPMMTTASLLVNVPDNTPQGAEVFITGDFEGWSGGSTHSLQYNGNGTYSIDLILPTYTSIQYKFTLGSWAVEEVKADGSGVGNRGLDFTVEDIQQELTIERWRALP